MDYSTKFLNDNKNFLLRLGIALISVSNFIWLSIGAYHSYPTTEDLMITAEPRDSSVINAAVKMLLTYDGRYTTNLLHGINPLAFDLYYGYKLMPIVTFGLLTIALFLLFNELFKHKKKIDNFIFSFAFVTFYFSILDLAAAIYWMICTFVYIYPLTFFLLFYRSFLVFKNKRKKRHFVYSIIFLFLSLGSCELHIPIFGFILALMFFHHRHDAFLWKIQFSYLSIYIASSLLFVTSPGISFRFKRYADTRFDTWNDLLMKSGEYTLKEFNTSGSITLILFIIIFATNYLGKIQYKQKILTFLLGVGMVYLTWVIMLYLKNDGYPSRIVSVPVSIAIFSALFICSTDFLHNIFVKYQWIFFGLFIITAMYYDNSYSSIKKDYRTGKLSHYKELMDENYTLLNQNRISNKECFSSVKINDVSASVPSSIAIGYLVIPPNREDSRWNNSYETYFKLDEVLLENDTVNILNQINEKIR